jgi:hypothetical protein
LAGTSSNSYYADTINVGAGSGTLAVGAIQAYNTTVSGNTLTTGQISASGGSLSMTGTTFNTGNLVASGSLTVNATAAYVPGAIALSGSTVSITAPTGIDTSTATVTASTANLYSNGGNVNANLTGTSYLNLLSGGAINVASNVALTNLYVGAKGDLLGGTSAITGSGQNFSYTTTGGSTANLNFVSPTAINFSYTELSPAVAVSAINLTTNLNGGGFLQVAGNGANINANAVALTNGSLNFSTAGDVNLNSVNSGGGYLVAASSAGNVNVTGVTTLGANVDLTATAGSILKAGANPVQIDTANGAGASSGAVYLRAANGSVGVSGSPITVNKTVDLTVVAKNEITLDMNGSALTNLYLTTGAGGTGAISIAGNPNFPSFSLTRSASDLLLGPVNNPAGNFYLIATDGNIKVNGDINVAALKLDARNNGYNPTGDLVIQASGGPRSVTASGAAYLYAGHDLNIQAGASAGENVTVQSGYLDSYVGHDLSVRGNGGSALLNLASTSSQNLTALHDISVVGGSASIAGASAAITSSGTQYLSAGNNLLIQAGSADGASATVHATSSQSVSAGGNVSLLGGAGVGSSAALQGISLSMTALQGALTVKGGSGSNAFAEIVAIEGYQSIGNQNNYYYNPTDFILVQGGGGSGSYASIRAAGSQSLYTVGDISVLGNSGSGAFAEILSSGTQSIGSTGWYYTPATQNILVQAGSGGIARIQAASSQTIMGGGNISVLGGSGTEMTAAIQSTGGSQTIGNTYLYNNDPTNNIIVQGGTGTGSAARIAAYTGQTIDAGQNITIAGGAIGAFAEVSTTNGSQNIGNLNSSSYDQTNAISLTGGAAGAYANMTAGGYQTIKGVGNITVTGGNGAASGALMQSGGGQALTTYGSLSVVAGTGSDAEVRQTSTASQTLTVTGSINVANAGGATAGIVSGGAQNITAADASVLVSSDVTGARAEIAADGLQVINLQGSTGNATLTVLNHSADVESIAQVTTLSDQTIAMPYTKAGTLQVGDTVSQGAAILAAGGNQSLLIGDLLVQGGATAAATAKVQSGAAGTMDISTLAGSIQVLGGAAGSAAIDPAVLNMTTNGSISVLAGAASTATALITAGNINMAATNGNVLVTGGAVSGATAGIVATGALNAYASGNMAITPGAGGATVSAGALTGNNIFLGGSCIGCTGGLVGIFNISSGLLPVTVSIPFSSPISSFISSPISSFIALVDPTTGSILSMFDNLQNLYGFLDLSDESEITIDLSRRRLPQCY